MPRARVNPAGAGQMLPGQDGQRTRRLRSRPRSLPGGQRHQSSRLRCRGTSPEPAPERNKCGLSCPVGPALPRRAPSLPRSAACRPPRPSPASAAPAAEGRSPRRELPAPRPGCADRPTWPRRWLRSGRPQLRHPGALRSLPVHLLPLLTRPSPAPTAPHSWREPGAGPGAHSRRSAPRRGPRPAGLPR